MDQVTGFSKLSKNEKIDFLIEKYFCSSNKTKKLLKSFWHQDLNAQSIFDEFSENTLTNFYLPYGVAPNFTINGKPHCIPMVTEESSVVAACAKSAKFWSARGGFHTQVLSTKKVGQVHFLWSGDSNKLKKLFLHTKKDLLHKIYPLLSSMTNRGGGLIDIDLIDKTKDEPNYYQLLCTFETCNAMGANFINTVLERIAQLLKITVNNEQSFSQSEQKLQIIMAILSNYTPECLARVHVECPIEELHDSDLEISAQEFAQKLSLATRIAKIDKFRAVTHNKGIFNGIDAVIMATGNDFRAIEACGHAYATKSGKYEGLTKIELNDDQFKMTLEVPLALGTVGGLTALHPLAKFSLSLLDNPSANELMQIAATVGLSQNFAALRSLVTNGIQKGHMKMHLYNILNQLECNESEREKTKKKFINSNISYSAVKEYISKLRDFQ